MFTKRHTVRACVVVLDGDSARVATTIAVVKATFGMAFKGYGLQMRGGKVLGHRKYIAVLHDKRAL